MTPNRRIAEWTGRLKALDAENPQVGDIVASAGPGGFSILVALEDKEWLGGEWLGGPSFIPWSPETDIALWHGPDGLFAKIEKKWLMAPFVEALIGELGMTIEQEHDGSLWVQFERVGPILRSEPSQLTVALLKCIEKENHDQPCVFQGNLHGGDIK